MSNLNRVFFLRFSLKSPLIIFSSAIFWRCVSIALYNSILYPHTSSFVSVLLTIARSLTRSTHGWTFYSYLSSCNIGFHNSTWYWINTGNNQTFQDSHPSELHIICRYRCNIVNEWSTAGSMNRRVTPLFNTACQLAICFPDINGAHLCSIYRSPFAIECHYPIRLNLTIFLYTSNLCFMTFAEISISDT